MHIHLHFNYLAYFLLGWACGALTLWEFMEARARCTPEKPCRCCVDALTDEAEHYANEG